MLINKIFFSVLLALSVTLLLPSCSQTESQPQPQAPSTQSESPTVLEPQTTQPQPPNKAKIEPNAVTPAPIKVKEKPQPTVQAPLVKPKAVKPKSKPVKKAIVKTGSLSGQITLSGKNNKTLNSANTVISLEPLFNSKKSKPPARSHKIVMQGKSYNPALINIHINDTIAFKNRDTIKHNVFSPSGENSFDLGTYGFGKTNQVTFNQAGIAKVYCNIHPDMATFIAISKSGYSVIVDKKGLFSLNHLPSGEYQLTAWNIRGQLSQKVLIKAGQATNMTLQLKTASYKKKQHKNKYGKNYKTQPSIFEDEFY
ncbi:MAG: hypothetical protein HRU20_03840 [Pseudomonadales bacterium]|nr:hypothetical protein [Pseudomonadales bacterium]